MRLRITMTNVVLAPTAQASATLGDLSGTTPSSGTARYYATDHLGSTRGAWDASKSSVGAYEFTPFGGEYNHTGAALATLAGAYTGKPWDGTAQLFHFPYRQYSPNMARWTSRDPLGMVDGPNVYGYVSGEPVGIFDPDGRWGFVLAIFGIKIKVTGESVALFITGAAAALHIFDSLEARCRTNCTPAPPPPPQRYIPGAPVPPADTHGEEEGEPGGGASEIQLACPPSFLRP
ncbi:MAG: RHS repeat-associated core domain-containing protein [Candidatus Hydrogenedentes bacterium]|nr:RHS repeat-associated core domain-containing protein [Candidatus Hydrogenedentota bacterium]